MKHRVNVRSAASVALAVLLVLPTARPAAAQEEPPEATSTTTTVATTTTTTTAPSTTTTTTTTEPVTSPTTSSTTTAPATSSTSTVASSTTSTSTSTPTIMSETVTVAATGTQLSFAATADARVEADRPDTNFGLVTPLRVDTSPAEESFLRFDVTGVTGHVTSAELRLYVTNGTSNGPTVYATDPVWSETGITWNTRPARTSSAADDLGAIPVDTWASFDVTTLVTGDGAVSFNLGRTSSDGVFFESREAADVSRHPQLVVTFDDGPPPPPPVTVSATPAGGTYTSSQTVTLSASEPADIHVTTDGSTPTEASPLYAEPIPVTATATLSFFAVTGDGRTSDVVVEQYVIDAGAPLTTTFGADADARVESAKPATTFGSATGLVADSSPATESYLRFDVAGLTGPVLDATLRLHVFNETVNGPAVYGAPSDWVESSITWDNRPARTATGYDDKGALAAGTWVEFDVDPLVTGNGLVTFVLATTSSDGVSFYARETSNTALRPELVITSEPGTPPIVEASPDGGSFDQPVDVTLSASEPATIYYTLDGTVPTVTSTVYTAPITIVATTTMRFFAVDADGAASAVASASYTITGDFEPPDTVIDSAPPPRTNETAASLGFSSSEPGSTFECSVDGAGFGVCASPHVVEALGEGEHVFAVRATDPAGNTDPTAAETSWVIDLTAPTVLSTDPADGALDVAVTSSVTATLSEVLDPSTVTTNSVALVRAADGSTVAATVTYDEPTATITITPTAILASGEAHTVTLVGGPGGVTDIAGNPLTSDVTWGFTTAGTSEPVTFTVAPTADAWVDSNSPNTNYGTEPSLTADTNPESASYLRFTLSGISAPVTSAYLRLFATSSTKNGPTVRAAGNGWTETNLTWNNRPAAIGAAVDDMQSVASQTWITYNVTPVITGDGTFDLVLLADSSDGVDFSSREIAASHPELVVTFGGPPPPSVAATPVGGSYPSPVSVTLTPSEPATVHYTTDGSLPTTESPVYSEPLDVSISQTLRFFAVTTDGRTSDVVTEVYDIAVTGSRGSSFGSASSPTAKEGQSKLWYTPDGWFAAMFQPSVGDFHIFRLDPSTQIWTDTGTRIDTRNTARIDALWDGTHLYTVSAVWGTSSSSRAEMRRFSYSNGTYSLDAGFPVVLNATGAEAVVMAKASDGTLWVTYTAGSKVMVTHSLGSDTDWISPYQIPGTQSSVSSDDVSSVVAVGGRIGVMWSNQNANAMYFATHVNGAPDSQWAVETAYAVRNEESADDHMNLAVASDGRVFAAVKTSLNDVGEPLIHLLVRGSAGGWSSHTWGTAEYNHTRPIVILDEQAGRVHVFASAPCCSGGVIYHKAAPMAAPDFPGGLGDVVLASNTDTKINNVTSTKQPVTSATGMVILAGDDGTDTYLHNWLDPAA